MSKPNSFNITLEQRRLIAPSPPLSYCRAAIYLAPQYLCDSELHRI